MGTASSFAADLAQVREDEIARAIQFRTRRTDPEPALLRGVFLNTYASFLQPGFGGGSGHEVHDMAGGVPRKVQTAFCIRLRKGVEPRGFEPLTSSMPLRRSTN
jgi:hypothetical protein